MLDHRPLSSLGEFRNEWLHARYHFSFSRYLDPHRTGLGPLLVWNDDTIEPEQGFLPHSHDNMEIITYIREGAITHEDRLGNKGRIKPGEVQIMSAGHGITHAEWNHEPSKTRLFQIWIRPNKVGLEPRWEEYCYPKAPAQNAWQVMVSGKTGQDSALRIHQDAALLRSFLEKGKSLDLPIGLGRGAYLVLSRGAVEVNSLNGETIHMQERDGLIAENEEKIILNAKEKSEILVVDVAMG